MRRRVAPRLPDAGYLQPELTADRESRDVMAILRRNAERRAGRLRRAYIDLTGSFSEGGDGRSPPRSRGHRPQPDRWASPETPAGQITSELGNRPARLISRARPWSASPRVAGLITGRHEERPKLERMRSAPGRAAGPRRACAGEAFGRARRWCTPAPASRTRSRSSPSTRPIAVGETTFDCDVADTTSWGRITGSLSGSSPAPAARDLGGRTIGSRSARRRTNVTR